MMHLVLFQLKLRRCVMERHEVEVSTKRKIQPEAETEVTVSTPSAPPVQVRKTAVATRSTPNLNREDESKRKQSKSRWDSPIELKPIPESDDGKVVKLSETTTDSQVSSSPPSKKAKIDESLDVAPRNFPRWIKHAADSNHSSHKGVILVTGILAMDCEMVELARRRSVGEDSIVNEFGCLYDKFVKPDRPVTDYRTEFSGIREADLTNEFPFSEHCCLFSATSFQTVKKEVVDLLKDRILVGHSLKHDFGVLNYVHPEAKTWDTAIYFKKYPSSKTPALRTLSEDYLEVEIQQGEHSSIVDAQATMALYQYYQLHLKEWEQSGRRP
ncbi:RNA exonuclease 4 [Orchesella cincta]|uniref:RNA exonuclease 4 n=1 Tax=Orchesella cincta TaxID=48709 RepID=A0A1D2MUS8_ORCCI|nr:RNA exonuclease 4 [Orchesella cincta]